MCRKMWLCRAQTIIHRMRKNNGHETSNNISFTLVKVRKKRENWGKYCKASECYFFLLRSVSLDISCFLSNRDSLIPFPSSCEKAFHSTKQIFYTKDTKKSPTENAFRISREMDSNAKRTNIFFMKNTVKI